MPQMKDNRYKDKNNSKYKDNNRDREKQRQKCNIKNFDRTKQDDMEFSFYVISSLIICPVTEPIVNNQCFRDSDSSQTTDI